MNKEVLACIRMTSSNRYLERRWDGDRFVDRKARVQVRLASMLSFEGLRSLISYDHTCGIGR